MSTLLDALSEALEGKKVGMEADDMQAAAPPDAVNKPEHSTEKPGVPPAADKKDSANAGDPAGPNNSKKIRTGDNQAMGNSNESAKEAEAYDAFKKKAVANGMSKVAAYWEEKKQAQEEAKRLNEQLTKLAQLTPEQLQQDWGQYVAAGQQFAVGAYAGIAKLATEMDMAAGVDPEIEAAIEDIAQDMAMEIAETVPEEQLKDPGMQAEIEETALAMAAEEVAAALEGGGGEGDGEAPPAGGGEGGGGEGGPPAEKKEE